MDAVTNDPSPHQNPLLHWRMLLVALILVCGGMGLLAHMAYSFYYRSGSCDRAIIDASPWLLGEERYTIVAKSLCSAKLDEGYLPCSITGDDSPYFCSMDVKRGTPDTVEVFLETCSQWSPHCSLHFVTEHKQSDLVFY